MTRASLIACAAAALFAGLVYVNALDNPFVYDDYRTVVDNGSIVSLTDMRAIVLHDASRPVVNLSYAIDRRFWGAAPFGFHVTSLWLHMISVMLLFSVALRAAADLNGRMSLRPSTGVPIRPTVVAFVAASLFAVHPMMTEAVGYVSGRSEVLCATWFLAGLLCARRWMLTGGTRWWLLSACFWVVALLTKEIAAMFPVVLLCYDRLLLETSPARRRDRFLRLHMPLLGLAAVAAVVRVAVFMLLEHPGALSFQWRAVLVELNVVARYLALLVVPAGQTIFHDVPPIGHVLSLQAWLGAAVVAVLLVLALRIGRTSGLFGLGLWWFLLLLVPASAMVVLSHGEAMAEHRVYLASCGLFLTAGWGAGWVAARFAGASSRAVWIAGAALAAVLLSLGSRTVLRTIVWSDPVMLWQEAVDRAPNHPLPRTVMGESLQMAGRPDEAIEAYRAALRLDPQDEGLYLKLGLCLAQTRRFEEATETFEALQRIKPESAFVPTGFGVVLLLAGRVDEARAKFQSALVRSPDDLMARRWLAVLEEDFAANPAEALRQCEEIRRIAPGQLSDDECVSRNRARVAALGAGSR